MTLRDPFAFAANVEIAHWPGVTVTFGERSKHRAATFTYRGVSRFVTYSATPETAWCGVRAFLTDVRATLRLLGAERVKDRRSQSPKRHRAGERPARLTPRKEPLKHDPSRDPWDSLRALLREAEGAS